LGKHELTTPQQTTDPGSIAAGGCIEGVTVSGRGGTEMANLGLARAYLRKLPPRSPVDRQLPSRIATVSKRIGSVRRQIDSLFRASSDVTTD
jgi:hypothetical protein